MKFFPLLSLCLALASYVGGYCFLSKNPDPHNGNWLSLGFFGLVLAAILAVGFASGAVIVGVKLMRIDKGYGIYVVPCAMIASLSVVALIPCVIYIVVGGVFSVTASSMQNFE